jgi:hypothetical protein
MVLQPWDQATSTSSSIPSRRVCESHFQQQQIAHHLRHLWFGRRAITGNRHLDRPRSVFVHGGALRRGGTQRDTARLAELQCAIGIAMHEYPLDRHHVWSVFEHQRRDTAIDALQSQHHILSGDIDTAARDVPFGAGLAIDHAIARTLRSGIQTQYAAVAHCQTDGLERSRCTRVARPKIAPGFARISRHWLDRLKNTCCSRSYPE